MGSLFRAIVYDRTRNNLTVSTHNVHATAPRARSYNYIFKVLFTAPSWYVFSIGFGHMSTLMRCGTHSHSIPEERYSNSIHRKWMCAGRIRGFHPHLLDVANSFHPHPEWQYMHIQQFNAHGIVFNNDLILVHSQ